MRNLGFEYRHKRESTAWKSRWDLAIVVGSFVPALLWGVAFTNIVRGVPIDANKEFVGNLWTLLNPMALLGGLVTLSLFLVHGALFVALKTAGPIREDARRLATRLGAVAAVLAVVYCSSSGSSRARPPRGSPPSSLRSPSSAPSERTCVTARAGRSPGRSPASPSPWRRCSSRCSPT